MAELTLKDLQVGGRNYFKRATNVGPLIGLGFVVNRDDNGVTFIGERENLTNFRLPDVIKSNDYYTISGFVKGNYANSVSFSFIDMPGTIVSFGTEWSYFSVTKYVNYHDNIYNFIDIDDVPFIYLYFKDLKIEKGNIATDWSPAPEDMAAVGEVFMDGVAGVVKNDEVAWDSSTGLYNSEYQNYSSLIAHFNLGVGSCPAAQLKFDYANGGIYYRSARDSHGFEKPWEKLSGASSIPQNALTTDKIFVGNTAPSSPKEGDIWFKR